MSDKEQKEKLVSIVLEGDYTPDDFLVSLKNGMGIKEIYQGNERLYERKSSYVFLELDSTLGVRA